MADSAGCCNKTEWELLVAILEVEQASFDRMQQVIDILANPAAGGATAANQTNCAQRTQIVDALCNTVAVTGNALDVNLKTGDIEIGAVEIKNSTTDDRATVNASGQLSVIAVAQPGVDIGDVTVNNGAGAAAVNIQDGGNSITVDGAVTASGTVTANQGTPAATGSRWPVQITDGTDLALVTGAGEQNVIATAQPGVDIGDVTVNNASGGSAVNIQDGGNSITVDLPAVTSGGTDTFHLVSAASTNATVIKASAGQVYGWYIYNSNAAARKVAFHNSASSPTAGASIFFTLVIPPSSGANVFTPHGIIFGTGIAMTTVTGLADADSAAVAANDLIINVWWK